MLHTTLARYLNVPGSNARRAGSGLAILVLSATVWADHVLAQPQLATSAIQQVQTLEAIKHAKTPVERKIDSRLYLALLSDRKDPRLAAMPDFRFRKAEDDGRVPVDILLNNAGGVKTVIDELEALGDVVSGYSYAHRTVSARIHLDAAGRLASIPQVKRIREAIPAYTNKLNTTEGLLTHGAEQAHSFFGTQGQGVKVCVISDGVNSLATLQSTGDLPAVDVLPGQAGSGDEGSAMLEIVHDLAPLAELGFATARPSPAQFAQNILDLAADGCNIIVDDVIYLDESPFQDGPVAQAVNTVTAAGVVFFSSAGNEGNLNDLTSGTWEGDFNPNGNPGGPLGGAGTVHNFGDGGQSILVQARADSTALIWAEHYDLSTGSASTDYDLYVLNGALTTVFDASTDVQDGRGGDDFPVEIMGAVFASERIVVAQFTVGTTAPPMFNLIAFRGQLDDALVTSGATRGHSAAAAAFSVAATPAAAPSNPATPPGPFPGLFTSANAGEIFSSDGPRRIILNPNGSEITPGNRSTTGGVVRQKPDITAADGVATAAPGFNPFYGTSAAAPHAAAIAALLKSAVPGLTPAQVRTALTSTAIDIEGPGVDRDTGVGIIMAQDALAAAGARPAATLTGGVAVPTEAAGDGDATVEPNEVWNLAIPITNIGGAVATGISAVLTTTTPGVVITAANSAYPSLAASATANSTTPFTFLVTAAVPCCRTISFTLAVNYSGGTVSSTTFDFGIRTGAAGTPVTFSYTGPPVSIPDGLDLRGNNPGAPAVASLPVTGVGKIFDIDLRIEGSTCTAAAGATTVGINHTFVNDLRIRLRSPGGTTVTVITNTDGSGNNFCQVVLDDESSGPSIQSVITSQAPFTGTYVANALLSAFDGEDLNGTWELEAQDYASQDIGSIREFSLIITPGVCDAPPLTSRLVGTKTVAGDFRPEGAITYMVTVSNAGTGRQLDNPGDELVDVLPPNVTLVSVNAMSGTAVANLGTNTVTWNGGLAAGAIATIVINGTVATSITAGTAVTNQGAINFDADGNGTNESGMLTDDPTVGGPTDPTAFLSVCQAITLNPASVPSFTEGTPVSQLFTSVGGIGTVTFTVTGSLPAALTLSSEGLLSGSPTAVGSFPVTITATDANGCTGTVALTLVVEPGGPTLTIETPTGSSPFASTSSFVTIKGTASDDGAGTTITWVTDRGASGSAKVRPGAVPLLPSAAVVEQAAPLTTVTWSAFIPLYAGANTLTINATNSTGLTTTRSVVATVDRLVYGLAEGATSSFFDAYLLAANPNTSPAPLSITYAKDDGSIVTDVRSIPAETRLTVRASDLPDLRGSSFAPSITSTDALPVLIERSMFWDASYYAGSDSAAAGASQTWCFSEGSTQSVAPGRSFGTYLLLGNAGATPATVSARFLTDTGAIVSRSYAVPPHARVTVWVNEIPELAEKGFGVELSSDVAITAERAMFLSPGLQAGHTSVGVNEPSSEWYHAEGAATGFFDAYLLLLNPSAGPAQATVTYYSGSGETITASHVVPANSRLTIAVKDEDPRLANASFWAAVQSDVPIVSERSMYWPLAGVTFGEGHNSTGVALPGTRWGLAEGSVGGPLNFQSFFLLANPSPTDATVNVTFLRTDGTTVVESRVVPALSRVTIWVNADVPELADESFGAVVASTNDVPIIVERSMYWSVQGQALGAGANATAIRLP